jgi:hypothetical protein
VELVRHFVGKVGGVGLEVQGSGIGGLGPTASEGIGCG